MIDLEDAARPPPAASLVIGNHRIRTVRTTSAGDVGARVVRDDPRDEDRGRQLDGVAAGSRLTRWSEQVDDLELVEILGFGFVFPRAVKVSAMRVCMCFAPYCRS